MKLLVPLMFAVSLRAGPYATAEVCKQCHPVEYAAQSASGHARALRPPAATEPEQWAFGAGNQAVTFVSQLNATDYLEHGETWYTATKRFDTTPGHADTRGLRYRLFDPSAGILRCFSCHSTGPLQVDGSGTIQPHELGVRCEDCHGPGAEHAANPTKVSLKKPGEQGGAAMNTACGACHRVQSSAEDGSNLLDPWNSRHQPLLLAASVCFQKSAGKLMCTTCHSPHQALEVRQETYNKACLGCHAAPKHSASVTGRPCAACHMPSVRTNANLAFVNHRIAVYSDGDALSPVTLAKH